MNLCSTSEHCMRFLGVKWARQCAALLKLVPYIPLAPPNYGQPLKIAH